MVNQYMGNNVPLLIIIIITLWTLFWKGYAVWTAAKNNHKGWFVAVLVLNTFGIIEIIYLFAIAKKKWSDVTRVFLQIILPKKDKKKKEEKQIKEEI
jgi:hypothetical protein